LPLLKFQPSYDVGKKAAPLNAVAFNSVWQYVSMGRGSVVDKRPAGRSGGRIPVGFSSPFETGLGAYPASCTMVSYPGR